MTDRPTDDYQPPPPTAPPTARGRVQIVGESRSVFTDDLYPLLLRRLQVAISIIAAFNLLVLGAHFLVFGEYNRNAAESEAQALAVRINMVHLWLNLTVILTLTAVLWLRPPSSVRGLRGIELLTLGFIASGMLLGDSNPFIWNTLEHLVDTPPLQQGAVEAAFAYISALSWFSVIVIYGTVIPNTWRRCAVVVSVLALVPLVWCAVFGLWFWPVDPAIVQRHIAVVGIHSALAVAIVVFAASRTEVLWRQAAEARRMGQYVLKERLGTGGMGEVYRAEHVLLRRPCAIKLIRPERVGDPKNLLRFEREVQATAALTHPNTVQIYDYGIADDGTFYYVMEYLPGVNLESLVKKHGAMQPGRVVHLLRQLCGALREAHAAGLIHRDIKPSNVIVCDRSGLRDVAKLLDFGIVDAPTQEPDAAITAPGQLLGTPAYMSPEQAAAVDELDARSDLASLGATGYFMLTGRPPFERPTVNLTIAAQLRDPVTPPHCLKTGVPVDLSEIIVRCLEKEPARRYQDSAELDRALASCGCAGEWTETRAAQAAQETTDREDSANLNTRELERRWGI